MGVMTTPALATAAQRVMINVNVFIFFFLFFLVLLVYSLFVPGRRLYYACFAKEVLPVGRRLQHTAYDRRFRDGMQAKKRDVKTMQTDQLRRSEVFNY